MNIMCFNHTIYSKIWAVRSNELFCLRVLFRSKNDTVKTVLIMMYPIQEDFMRNTIWNISTNISITRLIWLSSENMQTCLSQAIIVFVIIIIISSFFHCWKLVIYHVVCLTVCLHFTWSSASQIRWLWLFPFLHKILCVSFSTWS